ncbi:MAG: hypothetical protein K1000chlam2_00117 [Chlamydiae bacterium]|nr:hypothetical protein [Chlamydiota bacterium]
MFAAFKKNKLKFTLFLTLFSTQLCAESKYYLSVCAIFRNEARFLKEWIEYHQMIGVEHFYLFNNLSEDSYYGVLEPYVKKGIVELFDWPYESQYHKNWTHIQCGAYNKLIDQRRKETFWLAIIDTDEFIVPLKKETLPKFLKSYEKYGGIGINWQLYGTSDIYRIPDTQTLIGTLLKKAPENLEQNRFVKTIFQPKTIKEMKKPHHCKYKKGYFHVTENKVPFPANKSLTDTVSISKIRINHYTYRDEEFFYGEKQRRVAVWFPEAPPLEMNPAFNAEDDPIMLSFVPKLEKRLNH